MHEGVMQKENEIADVLGGKKFLGRSIKNMIDFDTIIRDGFPMIASELVKSTLNLSDDEFAATLGVSKRTLSRLRKKTRLPSVASDRLFRAARIFALAADVLESKENARKWLHSPQLSLGGKVPLDLLSTEAGTEKVENLLIRIEYGVIS